MTAAAAVASAQEYFHFYKDGKMDKRIEASLVDSISFGARGTSIMVYGRDKKQLYSGRRNGMNGVDSVVIKYDADHSSYPGLNISGRYNCMTPSYDAETQVYTLQLTGADPYILTNPLDRDLPEDSCVLAFEYNCPAGISGCQIFFSPVAEARSFIAGSIPPTTGAEWSAFSMPIKTYRERYHWGKSGDFLRLDFGSVSGIEIKLRGLHIRTMTPDEQREQARLDSIEAAKNSMAENIKEYLNAEYDSKVTSVSVTADSVEVSGEVSGEGAFVLADIAPYDDVTEEKTYMAADTLPSGVFSVRLPRKTERSGLTYDRVLSKWAIVKTDGSGRHTLASHARYADEVTPVYEAEPGVLKGKKGIAAGYGDKYIADFDSLQAHSITANIVLNSLISKNYHDGWETYEYGGRTYYINPGALSGCDNVARAASERGVIVSGIILTQTGSEFNDPENTGGNYTMPNMTTPEAVNFYAAALDYVIKRYTSTDGKNGRIHHWIMHNEVDMGKIWTNMGEQPEMRFYDRYVKSMRICYNLLRQYDQHGSVLGSYTHNWNIGGDYAPRQMLEWNVQYSEKEGDFRWGVAYHPYPIDLTRPEFWINDKLSATFNVNSPYVTFLNPEVINEWILRPEHFYKDGTKRILFFSEQGTNSPDYSENSLKLQAAGAAWIWKKISRLEGIDAMQWHNWADNRAEYGLRIGLRAYADGPFKELDPKPAWYVWQAAGTEREDEVFKPYLSVIGIPNWDNIIQDVK